MGKKRSAKRGKGRPDELNIPLHEAIKSEEEALAGENTEPMAQETSASDNTFSESPVVMTPIEEDPAAEAADVATPEEIPEELPLPEESTEPLEAPEPAKTPSEEISDKPQEEKTPEKKKFFSKDNVFEIVRYALMLICLTIFIVNGTKLLKSLIDYRRGADIYGSISDNIFTGNLGGDNAVKMLAKSPISQNLPDYYTALENGDPTVDNNTDSQYNQDLERMRVNLNHLRRINPDIYGYIHIEGTRISFPIVQGQDNEYYLDHAYNNEYVVVGAIFADFEVDRDIEKNPNTVIYGHNMRDGNMFNNVTLFYNEDVFNNTLIEIYTFDGLYTFKPFSIFETDMYRNYAQIDFETDEEFVAFCEHMQRCSVYDTGMTFTPEDRIITLSTCTTDPATYFNGRNALHAKLIKVEKYSGETE